MVENSTPRYLEDILVSIFCALLCFFGAFLWWKKKRMQPRDILKISWFLSSVLCCAFLGALWWKKSAFNPEIS